MLRTLTNLVRKAYGDRPLIRDLETWAKDTARLVTPDDLIAASIIQSFAKDFNKWKIRGSWTPWPSTYDYTDYKPAEPILSNGTTEVKFVVTRKWVSQPPYSTIGKYVDGFEGCWVDGTPLTKSASNVLKDAWFEISAKVKAAEEAAAKAKADMEANERKWNLAEKLLGMKRNEYGALVPIETVAS